jgi:hypothetical protein
MVIQWGDKGAIKDLTNPIHLAHESDDGCEYCCMDCNLDNHHCTNCGTISDHKNSPCGIMPADCYVR